MCGSDRFSHFREISQKVPQRKLLNKLAGVTRRLPYLPNLLRYEWPHLGAGALHVVCWEINLTPPPSHLNVSTLNTAKDVFFPRRGQNFHLIVLRNSELCYKICSFLQLMLMRTSWCMATQFRNKIPSFSYLTCPSCHRPPLGFKTVLQGG